MHMHQSPTRTETLGRLIEQRMAEAGITYRGASEATGIPLATLHRRIQTGAFTLPELLAVANMLGASASGLLRESEAAA